MGETRLQLDPRPEAGAPPAGPVFRDLGAGDEAIGGGGLGRA
jgi:hypothetical protein